MTKDRPYFILRGESEDALHLLLFHDQIAFVETVNDHVRLVLVNGVVMELQTTLSAFLEKIVKPVYGGVECSIK